MFDAPTPLRHPETPRADDTALGQAARSHVAGQPALQLIAELLHRLREARYAWWTPALLRETWGAGARMEWFTQRPDIRQRITSGLTGLRPKAARNKQPDYQAALVDSVIDEGDVTVDEFEYAFDAIELAAYAPAAEIWHRFRERMPWHEDSAAHQALVGWLIERLLADTSTVEGMTRTPILTAHAVRSAIPGTLWHARIPLEVRAAIDDLRLAREQASPAEPFRAADDLSLATPAIIAAHIPLRELLVVMDVAERAMGFPATRELPVVAAPARPAERVATEPRPADAKPETAVPRMPEPATPIMPEPAAPVLEAVQAAAPTPEKPQPVVAPAEKPQPAPVVAEKASEKPATRPADRASRWERMAEKVLEKVGKEAGPAEGPQSPG